VRTFGRNVWRHPMTVLDQHMEFAVAMGLTGRSDDDVFVDLDVTVNIVKPHGL
jgi:ureidoglycolate lyase